jgi:hypothetical protein
MPAVPPIREHRYDNCDCKEGEPAKAGYERRVRKGLSAFDRFDRKPQSDDARKDYSDNVAEQKDRKPGCDSRSVAPQRTRAAVAQRRPALESRIRQ